MPLHLQNYDQANGELLILSSLMFWPCKRLTDTSCACNACTKSSKSEREIAQSVDDSMWMCDKVHAAVGWNIHMEQEGA